ncbi:hypothetical protein CFIMG_003589RA [Ceratocystis fimbriata CBS 114723]|uniref:Uncharacterized protein n=1 Tax=Ceratocystis fimbriata CBS 114723 TaxID=1035309 RepID=A0A2C5XC34_9PEZI|nr:hypothetical protein CFIMG_003589RA [Ceratocystis fimbriata CBS 114723]
MPGSAASSGATSPIESSSIDALTNQVEKGKVKFLIQTGGKKYHCVLKDRVAHERQKAALSTASSSAASVNSGESSP